MKINHHPLMMGHRHHVIFAEKMRTTMSCIRMNDAFKINDVKVEREKNYFNKRINLANFSQLTVKEMRTTVGVGVFLSRSDVDSSNSLVIYFCS
jgi:hypothetical protein